MSCSEQTERFKTKISPHQDIGSPVMVNCIEQRAFLPQGVNGDGLAEAKAGTPAKDTQLLTGKGFQTANSTGTI